MHPEFQKGDVVRFNIQKGKHYEKGINNYDAVLTAQMYGFGDLCHRNHNCWYVQFLDGPFSEDKRYRYNVHEKFLIHKQNYPESVYFEKGGLPIL